MLEAYSTAQTIAATTGAVPFTNVSLVKGQTAVLSGTNTIQLNRAGIYMVHAVVSGVPAAAGTASIQIYKDGVAQPEATSSTPSGLTTVGVNLAMATLVQVREDNGCCCRMAPTVLQLINTGVGLNNANANIVITKVC